MYGKRYHSNKRKKVKTNISYIFERCQVEDIFASLGLCQEAINSGSLWSNKAGENEISDTLLIKNKTHIGRVSDEITPTVAVGRRLIRKRCHRV